MRQEVPDEQPKSPLEFSQEGPKMKSNDLLWVTATPAGQTPKEIRTQIRKQVMKAAVEAKRRKPQKSARAGTTDPNSDAGEPEDQREPPALVSQIVRGKLVLTPAKGTSLRRWTGHDSGVPAHLPLTGIEVLVNKHGLDRHTATQVFGCVNLETLCSHFLNAHPQMLSQLVIQPDEAANEYFGHVVRYYGHLQCLDDALQTVVAQVQANLCPQSGPSGQEILAKYGKALRSLQEAISSASWEGPEVLCATQLLALFEILHGGGLDRWRGHIQGATRLMRLRGPGKHRTPFDINLFLNLHPAIACESFMKCQPCLFVEPEWQEFIDDIMDHDDPFSERGSLNLSASKLLFKAVDAIPTVLPLLISAAHPDEPQVLKVADDAYQVAQECAAWFHDFNTCIQKLAPEDRDWTKDPRLLMTYGCGSMTHMLFCRVVAILTPSRRAEFERISQMRAAELLQLVASVPADDHRTKLLMRQKKNLAMGVLMTVEDWEERIDSGKLIDLDVFLKWCQIIGDSAHREYGDLTADGAFVRFDGREMERLMSGQPGFEQDVEAVAEPGLPDRFYYWKWDDVGE